MHGDRGWQVDAWAGVVCVLLAANGFAQDRVEQAVFFFGAAIFLFLWAAWLARGRR